MTTYYVKAAGNAGNTGLSDAQAWTIDKARSFSFSTSDKVYLKCGDTFTPSGSWNVNWQGTSGSRAVIGAYYMDGGTEVIGVSGNRPIISGNSYAVPANSWKSTYDSYVGLIEISSKDYVTVEDIEIKESGWYGLRVVGNLNTGTNASNFLISNVKTTGSYSSGIAIVTNANNYGTIDGCEVSGAGYGYFIGEEGDWPVSLTIAQCPYSYTTVKNCYVHENYGEGIGSIRVPSSTVTNNSGYATIEDNIVWNNRRVHVYIDCTTNNVIRRNVLLGGGVSVVGDFGSYYPSGAGRGFNQWGVWINREYRSDYGGTISISNNEVYLNLIAGIGVGIGVASEVTGETYSNIKFYRNTLLSNYTQISIGSGINSNTMSGCEIKGNLIGKFGDDQGGAAPSTSSTSWWATKFTWSHNVWPNQPNNIWNATYDKIFDGNIQKSSGWQQLTSSISAANAKLLSSSNAINAGTSHTVS